MSQPKEPDMADTAELPLMPQEKTSASAGVGRVRVDYGALTHQGLVRTNNEDHYFAARFGRFLSPLTTNLAGHATTLFEEEGYAMAVAVASSLLLLGLSATLVMVLRRRERDLL